MTNVAWRDYDTASEMASAVADHIGLFVEAALDSRGSAGCAARQVPIPLFERLATANIDWSRVTIIPTDDRLVPVTDLYEQRRDDCPAFLANGRPCCQSSSKETPIIAQPVRRPMRSWPRLPGPRILSASASVRTDAPHRFSRTRSRGRARWPPKSQGTRADAGSLAG